MKYAALALEDGSVRSGVGFGAVTKSAGEVVFNTGMVGYVQSITDPSFFGQIVCQTYPLIGNYGVDPDEFESDGPKIRGYVISELCRRPSHYRSRQSLDDWLSAAGIPGIEGIDTRELTKTLRIKGTMLGLLAVSPVPIDEDVLRREAASLSDPNLTDLVGQVSVKEPVIYEAVTRGRGGITPAEKTVVLVDCGVKTNIIRCLTRRTCRVIRVPSQSTVEEILHWSPDGVLFSNGPGDPKKAEQAVAAASGLIERSIPVFGICLGNQILALALGCDTYKLKFGHRGQNHPVKDLATGRMYITSQNHGYAVDRESLSGKPVAEIFSNCNDGTTEGITHTKKPLLGVQFHPEAAPGPRDTEFLFDRFLDMIKKDNAVR